MHRTTKQGVRDLNSLKPSVDVPEPAKPSKESCSELDKPIQQDLIYDSSAKEDILTQFPNAKIAEVWDYIHDTRLKVVIPDCSLRSWFMFLLDTGWAGVSFVCQMYIIQDTELISGLMDEINPGWRNKNR